MKNHGKQKIISMSAEELSDLGMCRFIFTSYVLTLFFITVLILANSNLFMWNNSIFYIFKQVIPALLVQIVKNKEFCSLLQFYI